MILQIEFDPHWKVGDIIRVGNGKSYKIVKKTTSAMSVTPYYFWNRWWDRLVKKDE